MMLECLTEVLPSLLFHMLNLSQVEWMKGRSHTFFNFTAYEEPNFKLENLNSIAFLLLMFSLSLCLLFPEFKPLLPAVSLIFP